MNQFSQSTDGSQCLHTDQSANRSLFDVFRRSQTV